MKIIEYFKQCPKCGCPGYGYMRGSGRRWIICAKCLTPYAEE